MVFAQSEAVTSLAAEDLARAKDFYTNKLGLKLLMESSEQLLVVGTEKGSRILLYQREKSKAEHTVLNFVVSDFTSAVEKLKANGISLEIYEGFTDEHGIATRGEGGAQTAWFKDSEENIINISTGLEM